jgi:hypothetical protein
MMSANASSYGLPCSKIGQPLRRQGRMRGNNTSTRAINELGVELQKMVADIKELDASVEARANTTIKQEEDHAICVRVMDKRE